MRYPIPAIIGLFMLGGCTQWQAGSSAALNAGAEFNDEAVIAAETVLCRAASVGSIERRFMRSSEDWQTWNDLCRSDEPVPLP